MSKRILRAIACAIFVLATACREAEVRPRNVVFVLIDTLRADRLGSYGSSSGLTPFLDELASRGAVLKNVYAASSWTCPSVASLFTSRFPSQHRVSSFASKLSEAEVTLAEKLEDSGFGTVGFVANMLLVGSKGYNQGFEHWRVIAQKDLLGAIKVRGSRMRPEIFEWLAEVSGSDQRAFLYLHYMEPHSPYGGRAPTKADGDAWLAANAKLENYVLQTLPESEVELLRFLYNREIKMLDAELKLVFDELERTGFLDSSLIVVTSDHGELFAEHDGLMLHGHSLFNHEIHVPLIVIGPGIQPGRIVREPASLVDLAPTLLDLLEIPAAPSFEGRSLRDALTSDQPGQPVVDVLSELPRKTSAIDLRRHSQALVRGARKLLVTPSGSARTYDLASDPGEKKPSARSNSSLLGSLQRRITALAARASSEEETVPIDDATREKLRVLGYGS